MSYTNNSTFTSPLIDNEEQEIERLLDQIKYMASTTKIKAIRIGEALIQSDQLVNELNKSMDTVRSFIQHNTRKSEELARRNESKCIWFINAALLIVLVLVLIMFFTVFSK